MPAFSLLLTGLTQRLCLAACTLLLLWGVYFWATADDTDLPNEPVAEVSQP